ncbi:MAG: response regulator transcription factor, partial [Acidimicrobiia bacterium]|nr:response regulator transcription factor [Acidimicrobiia bacterium]
GPGPARRRLPRVVGADDCVGGGRCRPCGRGRTLGKRVGRPEQASVAHHPRRRAVRRGVPLAAPDVCGAGLAGRARTDRPDRHRLLRADARGRGSRAGSAAFPPHPVWVSDVEDRANRPSRVVPQPEKDDPMAGEGIDRSAVHESATTPAARPPVQGVEPPSLAESFPNVDWNEAADEPVHPLTSRELDVLRYLPTRLSNIDIGARLRISQNTVKTHLKDIYRKLRVSSRNEAVVAAVRLGLLSLTEDKPGDHDGRHN